MSYEGRGDQGPVAPIAGIRERLHARILIRRHAMLGHRNTGRAPVDGECLQDLDADPVVSRGNLSGDGNEPPESGPQRPCSWLRLERDKAREG